MADRHSWRHDYSCKRMCININVKNMSFDFDFTINNCPLNKSLNRTNSVIVQNRYRNCRVYMYLNIRWNTTPPPHSIQHQISLWYVHRCKHHVVEKPSYMIGSSVKCKERRPKSTSILVCLRERFHSLTCLISVTSLTLMRTDQFIGAIEFWRVRCWECDVVHVGFMRLKNITIHVLVIATVLKIVQHELKIFPIADMSQLCLQLW